MTEKQLFERFNLAHYFGHWIPVIHWHSVEWQFWVKLYSASCVGPGFQMTQAARNDSAYVYIESGIMIKMLNGLINGWESDVHGLLSQKRWNMSKMVFKWNMSKMKQFLFCHIYLFTIRLFIEYSIFNSDEGSFSSTISYHFFGTSTIMKPLALYVHSSIFPFIFRL